VLLSPHSLSGVPVVFHSLDAVPFGSALVLLSCLSTLSQPSLSSSVFRRLVAAPFNSDLCYSISRTAARDHLAVPRYMARYSLFLLELPFP
jgi:hypothetical protein